MIALYRYTLDGQLKVKQPLGGSSGGGGGGGSGSPLSLSPSSRPPPLPQAQPRSGLQRSDTLENVSDSEHRGSSAEGRRETSPQRPSPSPRGGSSGKGRYPPPLQNGPMQNGPMDPRGFSQVEQ